MPNREPVFLDTSGWIALLNLLQSTGSAGEN